MATFDKAYTKLPLTSMSLAYRNDATNYIGNKIFPMVKVAKQAWTIYSYGKDALRRVNTKRATRWAYNAIELWVTKSDHYYTENYGLAGFIYQDDLENAEDPINADRDTTLRITDKMLLDYESQALWLLNTTNFWAGYNTQLSWTSQFDDYANSDPFLVIRTVIDAVRAKSWKMPNNMAMAYNVFSVLSNHPKVIARFPWATIITQQMLQDSLARLFWIQNLWVSMAQETATNTGAATEPLTDLLSKKIFVYYSEPAQLQSLSLGKTYVSSDMKVAKYPQNFLGANAIRSWKVAMIMTEHKYDIVIVSQDCGHLIYDVIS